MWRHRVWSIAAFQWVIRHLPLPLSWAYVSVGSPMRKFWDRILSRPAAWTLYFLFQLGLEDMWLSVLNFFMGPRKLVYYPGQTKVDRGGHFFVVRCLISWSNESDFLTRVWKKESTMTWFRAHRSFPLLSLPIFFSNLLFEHGQR